MPCKLCLKNNCYGYVRDPSVTYVTSCENTNKKVNLWAVWAPNSVNIT